MFILLYLVSGADRDDNGEGRKLRPRDKTPSTNNNPQGSEDARLQILRLGTIRKIKNQGAGTGHFRTQTMEQWA